MLKHYSLYTKVSLHDSILQIIYQTDHEMILEGEKRNEMIKSKCSKCFPAIKYLQQFLPTTLTPKYKHS